MRLVSRFPLVLCAAIAGCLLTDPVRAQVPLTTLGSASTQSFNSLATTGTNPWLDNTTLIGWYSQFSAVPTNPTTYIANDGSSNTGAIYSYGTGTNAERAFGSASSGTPVNIFNAVRLVNNTGSTITSVDISYVGEQWRNGGNATAQQLDFQYRVVNPGTITDANTPATLWNDFNTLDFVSPTTGATAAALDGNAAANRTAKSGTLTVTVNAGQEIWLRWMDINDAGNDHGLAVDDFSVTPQGAAGTVLNVGGATVTEGNAGTVTASFLVSLTAPAGPGGVTFDIATVDGTATTADNDYVGKSLTGQTIPAGSSTYNFDVTVNGDTTVEPDQTFSVNVTNIVGATPGTNPGLGTIQNDDVTLVFIHDVQGNGAATPVPGATVTVEGVVVADFQGTDQLSGFFLQEEDADVDADPATSEGILIFCMTCPTPVAEGQRVRVTGVVSEFNNMTEITAATTGSVTVTNAGNNLAQVTPSPIDLPVVGDINTFYEAREGMRVTFVDTLTVAEYFELARFGHIELFEGGRPRQFTEMSPPNAAGLAAHLANLDRRRVILDDDDNNQNSSLTPFQPDGSQFVFHPQANGGFSVGTQGTDFFRGGDLVNGLTGVLHWSFPGVVPDTWRLRPTAATPATFTVANPRPATPPAVGGAIKAVGMNLLNYFTTIDTTASNNSGPCGPSGTLDCRGADSVAELNRQRERASIVICGLNAHVYGFNELENTASATINDLLGAVNARCGGANPYAFVNTGGTLGTDAIRVMIIYRTGILSPVGAALVDLDSIHNRPPTAQTFDVVDATNPAFGERFTVIPNHFKSKGCDASATGADADTGDGQSCYNGRRTAQATRLLTWITSTVLPAAGDPDVLLLGDFNSYAQENPITTLAAGGYTDIQTALLGANAYSYLFDGQLGHLDYALASTSLFAQVSGVGAWHINADEASLFDYSDEIRDVGEAAFEEKPDGSALVPPRVLFQPASPYRAADHDPVIVGIFQIADLSVTKEDNPDPVTAGTNLTYTITVSNAGPDAAATASWSDTLPAGTTFVSLPVVAGWTCTTPAVGAGGTVSCSNPSFAVGSAAFTLTVAVAPSVAAGTVITNTATATSAAGDPTPGNDSGTAATTVGASADLSVTKVDTPDPVTAGTNLTYTITVTNAGPSNAATVSLSDPLPAGTTFVSLTAPAGWSCTTPAVGAGGTVSCSFASLPAGSVVFTLTVAVAPSTVAGTVISNTATVTSATTDPTPANGSATATTTVGAGSADLSVTKSGTGAGLAGTDYSYTITVANAGPSAAASATWTDTLPAMTTFVSLSSVAGWTCTTPAVGSGGLISCSNPSFAPDPGDTFTLVIHISSGFGTGTLSNTADVTSTTPDPAPANNSDTEATGVDGSADLAVTKVDSVDPVQPGTNLAYTITLTNNGSSDSTFTTLSDPLPAGTTFISFTAAAGFTCTTPAVGGTGTVSCSGGTVLAGASAVFTLTVQVGVGVAPGTVLTNTATADGPFIDPNSGNDAGTATTTVGAGSADLSIAKVDTPDPVNTGANLTYTITATNAGPSDATTAAVSDTLPAGTTFVSLSAPAGWTCTTPAVGSGGTVSCSIPSFTVGSAVFTLTVQVAPTVAGGTVLANTASITSATADPNPGSESATTSTNVLSPATLSGTKSVAGDFAPNGAITYTIVLSNSGPSTQGDNPGDELTDVLPPGLALISASSNAGSIAAGNNTVTWNGSLAAGASVTITIQAGISASAAPGTTISNQATFLYDANGDGLNEAAGVTDAPGGTANDPTNFVVGGGEEPQEIPTLDTIGLALLAVILALGGMAMLRRRRNA